MSKEKGYVVLYKRDVEWESKKKYGKNKRLYDESKNFEDISGAVEFALDNLPSMLVGKLPLSEEARERVKNPGQYVAIAKYEGKYMHYDYGGGCDALTNYDAIICSEKTLAETVEKLGEEKNHKCLREVIAGIELKVL
jgi:hypothetical protein